VIKFTQSLKYILMDLTMDFIVTSGLANVLAELFVANFLTKICFTIKLSGSKSWRDERWADYKVSWEFMVCSTLSQKMLLFKCKSM